MTFGSNQNGIILSIVIAIIGLIGTVASADKDSLIGSWMSSITSPTQRPVLSNKLVGTWQADWQENGVPFQWLFQFSPNGEVKIDKKYDSHGRDHILENGKLNYSESDQVIAITDSKGFSFLKGKVINISQSALVIQVESSEIPTLRHQTVKFSALSN